MPIRLPTSIRHTLLFAALTPLALLWGEFFTRAFAPQSLDARLNIFQSDEVIGFTFKPRARAYETGREYRVLYEINGLGMRDRDYGPKADSTIRVMLVGDSFAVSHGLSWQDSLPRKIESFLQDRAARQKMGTRVEVANAANGAYSPFNYWKSYVRWAPVLHPDVVLVAFYLGNDWNCDNEDASYVIRDGELVSWLKHGEQRRDAEAGVIISIRKWLSYTSQFYVLARNYLYYNETVGRASRTVAAAGLRDEQWRAYLTPPPDGMDTEWQKCFGYLDRLNRAAEADGASVIVLLVPPRHEVDDATCRRMLESAGLTPVQVDMNQPAEMVTAYCRKHGIPVLDPRSALRDRHAKATCYFQYDGHLNAQGVEVAAKVVADQFLDRLLAKGPAARNPRISAAGEK